jgi:hypothetical protein
MKSEKVRRLFGLIGVSIIVLSGLSLSGVGAETALVSEEEIMGGGTLSREMGKQNAAVPPLQVWNMTRLEVKEARLNWATSEMGKAVFAAVRGEETAPIPHNAVHIVQTEGGFGHLDDFRLALTLLSEERGQSMTHLVPGPLTPNASRANNYTGAGWGGFAEYGFASLVAFAYVMWMASWVAIDLERHGVKEEEKPYQYPMAA